MEWVHAEGSHVFVYRSSFHAQGLGYLRLQSNAQSMHVLRAPSILPEQDVVCFVQPYALLLQCVGLDKDWELVPIVTQSTEGMFPHLPRPESYRSCDDPSSKVVLPAVEVVDDSLLVLNTSAQMLRVFTLDVGKSEFLLSFEQSVRPPPDSSTATASLHTGLFPRRRGNSSGSQKNQKDSLLTRAVPGNKLTLWAKKAGRYTATRECYISVAAAEAALTYAVGDVSMTPGDDLLVLLDDGVNGSKSTMYSFDLTWCENGSLVPGHEVNITATSMLLLNGASVDNTSAVVRGKTYAASAKMNPLLKYLLKVEIPVHSVQSFARSVAHSVNVGLGLTR
jgi:hypothetical protein